MLIEEGSVSDEIHFGGFSYRVMGLGMNNFVFESMYSGLVAGGGYACNHWGVFFGIVSYVFY